MDFASVACARTMVCRLQRFSFLVLILPCNLVCEFLVCDTLALRGPINGPALESILYRRRWRRLQGSPCFPGTLYSRFEIVSFPGTQCPVFVSHICARAVSLL